MAQSKFWVFTVPNPLEGEKNWPKVETDEGDDVAWCVYQPERGANGLHHLQGCCAFGSKKRLLQLTRKYKGCHWEMMKGTCAQAKAYCRKDDTFFEFGGFKREEWGLMPAGQGARTDIAELRALVVQPGGLKRVADEHPEAFLRYSRLPQWSALLRPPRPNVPREVKIYYGAPGTGKSRTVREQCAELYVPATNNAGLMSFESYDAEKGILLDDFEAGNMTSGGLKVMTDRYANKLPGRGTSVENHADYIYITSNTDPRLWFPKDPTFWPAIVRRATEIVNCQEHVWTTEVMNGVELMPAERIERPNPYYLL